MDTTKTSLPDRTSAKKRFAVIAAFSAAYSLTATSIVNLLRWRREYPSTVVQYRTVTRGPEAAIEVCYPTKDKGTGRHRFYLNTPQEWRSLRSFIADDIRAIAQRTGTRDAAEAAIEKIEAKATAKELKLAEKQGPDHVPEPLRSAHLSSQP